MFVFVKFELNRIKLRPFAQIRLTGAGWQQGVTDKNNLSVFGFSWFAARGGAMQDAATGQ